MLTSSVVNKVRERLECPGKKLKNHMKAVNFSHVSDILLTAADVH
jgi:hypothetical protein